MARDGELSRRRLLGVGSVTAATALLAGCTGQGLTEDDPSVDIDGNIYDDWEWNGDDADDETDEEGEPADDDPDNETDENGTDADADGDA